MTPSGKEGGFEPLAGDFEALILLLAGDALHPVHQVGLDEQGELRQVQGEEQRAGAGLAKAVSLGLWASRT